ncbi:acyl-CoA dehydrogenase family protein [Natrarchaeobaculum sulfurireducens]|uniref:Acyl-CoA dehydrogenase n=1 Tax=Natrarchaeobaculum sulfurireducens TaxID=2044521 RepID=A0A346PU70_9EURY|nr:acyl-CoA dehydrogenase family protein [Natrarchaeobaculum sulfurireducens]AXR79291.1 Acyl-CoA dehydrogenase [Natrarchaeobaculum sulfurireducens]AXR83065.1 Butyryl-CoA dehydrogenase [Natrarchaeobaculum sulfurireducens]
MDYTETDEHRLIRDSVREIAGDYDRAYWKGCIEENEFPEAYWADLARDGWLGVTIPEEYGGAGLGMLEMSMVIEELSRGGGQGGIIFVLTPVFGGISIQRHGTEEQKERYLPAIVDGEMRFCMGLTEAGAGTNTLNIDTTAERDGDEFVVSGQKMWISGVENADEMLLIARTSDLDPDNPTHGVSMFLVPEPAERDGISLTPLDVEVPWFETQYQVDIDGLRVHEDRILGAEDGGLYLLWDTLNTERIAGAASAIGGGLRAVDLAVDYANDRSVFGQKIGGHQAIQHPLADAYAELLCAREMTYKAASKWDQGEDAGTEANVAKLRSSEAATKAADRAIQTHGGNGFSADYEVYDIWQNSRLLQTVPITNEMVRNFLAEHTLGLPRSY